MAYASTDIGSLRFLAANVIYQCTQAMLQASDEKDADALHDACMMMDVVSSYYTEEDGEFKQEWQAIQNARGKAKWAPGEDQGQDLGFRWMELKAMFRSLCRKGTFVRIESPAAPWKVDA